MVISKGKNGLSTGVEVNPRNIKKEEESEYMILPYNPSIFEADKRFLNGKQSQDLANYIAKRYYKNKKNMDLIQENTTKTFVRSGSNIYSKDVSYPEWEKKKWIKRRKREIGKLEQYYNLNARALFWTYNINGKEKFKALHASEFIQVEDVNNDVLYTIVKVGKSADINKDQKAILYNFKIWKAGKIYKVIAEDWDLLPKVLTSDLLDKDQSNYEVLPFTLIGKDNSTPVLSPLIIMECVLAGGVAWGDISARRNFLKQIYGSTMLSAPKWKELVKQLGLFDVPDLKRSEDGQNNTLSTLDLGDGKTQLEWMEFIEKSFKRLAYAEGVDINGLFSDVKVESGVARILAMENIVTVRDSKIGEWEEFEEEDQQVLQDLKIVNKESEVIYADLIPGETALTKEQTEKQRQENITYRYANGTITKVMMVMEMEGLNESEAQERLKAIETERTGSENGDSKSKKGVIQAPPE